MWIFESQLKTEDWIEATEEQAEKYKIMRHSVGRLDVIWLGNLYACVCVCMFVYAMDVVVTKILKSPPR